MFEDAKGVIRNRKSRKINRQYNGQKKNDKKTNNGQQNITQKTKKSSNTNGTKTRGELGYPGMERSSCSTCSTRRVALVKESRRVTIATILHLWL